MDSPTGARISALLTFAVGLLSVVTGILHITYTLSSGPFAAFVPPVLQNIAGFTGTITGFTMMLGAYGLQRRYRVGLYTTVVLLPITTIQGLVQSSILSVPLIVLSIAAFPVVIASRNRFREAVDLTSAQIAAGVTLLGVQVYGTVGTYSLREQFVGVNTVLDAFYYTIVTASTVGYGDVYATTQTARLFAMSVLLFGTASFAVAIGVLLGPLIEARLAASLGRVRNRELSQLEDHVLVLGYGDLTEPLIDELAGRTQFAVVTQDESRVAKLTDRDITVLNADPGDEASLRRVNIEDARAVVAATTDDAEDAFTILTIRELTPEARIIAAAANSENVAKLHRAGADVVFDPAHVGAQILIDAAYTD